MREAGTEVERPTDRVAQRPGRSELPIRSARPAARRSH